MEQFGTRQVFVLGRENVSPHIIALVMQIMRVQFANTPIVMDTHQMIQEFVPVMVLVLHQTTVPATMVMVMTNASISIALEFLQLIIQFVRHMENAPTLIHAVATQDSLITNVKLSLVLDFLQTKLQKCVQVTEHAMDHKAVYATMVMMEQIVSYHIVMENSATTAQFALGEEFAHPLTIVVATKDSMVINVTHGLVLAYYLMKHTYALATVPVRTQIIVHANQGL